MEKKYDAIKRIIVDTRDIGPSQKVSCAEFSEEDAALVVDEYFSNIAGEDIHVNIQNEKVIGDIIYRHAEEYLKTQYGKNTTVHVHHVSTMDEAEEVAKETFKEENKHKMMLKACHTLSVKCLDDCVKKATNEKVKAELIRCQENEDILAMTFFLMDKCMDIDHTQMLMREYCTGKMCMTPEVAEEVAQNIMASAIARANDVVETVEKAKKAKGIC